MSFNVSLLPNPLTPMAFLPPKLAFESQVALQIVVGTMGAFVWDLLSHLDEDYRIITKTKFSLGTAAYFWSRLWTFIAILGSVLFRTYPLGNCRLAMTLELTATGMCVAFTSLLFFLRAAAVYDRNPWFRVFLFTMWLSVLAAGISLPIGIHGGNIGPTPYCSTASAKPYTGSMISIIPLIHDTVVFIAISWRLLQNAYVDDTTGGNFRAFFSGKNLPSFSRAVLVDGQMYYLVAVACNILTLAIFETQTVPIFYRTLFAVPDAILVNIMAGIVFRNTKLGYTKRIMRTSEWSLRGGRTGTGTDNHSIVFMNPMKTGQTGQTSSSGPGKTVVNGGSRTTLGVVVHKTSDSSIDKDKEATEVI
ncbi:hypothetical protein C8F01DRAFT_1119579 [Mycena amicta]|nr:hypothetical protein C8F01DRAFT_1119579 [Mycena amicta]